MPANYCTQCGAEAGTPKKFCPQCGNPIGSKIIAEQATPIYTDNQRRHSNRKQLTLGCLGSLALLLAFIVCLSFLALAGPIQ
jgi:uncharacterized membrane protein YvbJ